MDLHPVSLTYYYKRRDDLLAACMLSTVEHYDGLRWLHAERLLPSSKIGWPTWIAGHFEIQRRDRLGIGPPIGTFAELRLIAEPNRTLVLAAHQADAHAVYGAVPDRLTGPWTPIRRAALTRLMIEHLGWSRTWLATLHPDDYPAAAGENGRYPDRRPQRLRPGLAGRDPNLPGRADHRWRYFAPAVPDRRNRDDQPQRLLRGLGGEDLRHIGWVTKGSFYYHNADKDGLFAACVEYALEILRQGQNAAYPGNGFERLCASVAVAASRYQASGARGRMLRSYALVSLAPGGSPAAAGAAIVRRPCGSPK